MTAALTPEVEIGTEVPTALYRLFAASGSLLYVGITGNLKTRLGQHASEKPWWPTVSRKTVAWYPSRSDALGAEAAAIRDERPLHNARRELAPIRQERFRGLEKYTREYFIQMVLMLMSATEHDVRQWHARMILTAAPNLLEAFDNHEVWWDRSPELQNVLEAMAYDYDWQDGAAP